MSFMHGEWYVVGARDHVEFYGPKDSTYPKESIRMPYDKFYDLVINAYDQLSWSKKQQLRISRWWRQEGGRPFLWIPRKPWIRFEIYVLEPILVKLGVWEEL